jgi:hypothetical protein
VERPTEARARPRDEDRPEDRGGEIAPPEVRVEASPTRCPYCHASIAAEPETVVCASCLSRHHKECWTDTCASCGRGQALAAVPATEHRPWERPMVWINRAWLASFVFVFVGTFVATMVSIAAGGITPKDEPPLWFMLATMLPMFLSVAIALPMMLVNLIDAAARFQRDRRALLPLALAALGICTGGLTSFAYYFGWGWQPLPADPTAPPPTPPRKPPLSKD